VNVRSCLLLIGGTCSASIDFVSGNILFPPLGRFLVMALSFPLPSVKKAGIFGDGVEFIPCACLFFPFPRESEA